LLEDSEGIVWVNWDDAQAYAALEGGISQGVMTKVYQRLCRYVDPRRSHVPRSTNINYRGELYFPQWKRMKFDRNSLILHFADNENRINFAVENGHSYRLVEIFFDWVEALQEDSNQIDRASSV
jgi:hypothetical protein